MRHHPDGAEANANQQHPARRLRKRVYETAERTEAVARHHDEIRFVFTRIANNLMSRIAFGQHSPHIEDLELVGEEQIEFPAQLRDTLSMKACERGGAEFERSVQIV